MVGHLLDAHRKYGYNARRISVDALGVNCSLGPNEILEIIKKLKNIPIYD